MVSFLYTEAGNLQKIREAVPGLAIVCEYKVFQASKKYLSSLWEYRREQMNKEKKKEYHDNPAILIPDLIIPPILRGVELEHPGIIGVEEDYVNARNLYVRNTLEDALSIIDYLDYESLLEYLRYFKQNTPDSAVAHGDLLARIAQNNKTRVDGTPLPKYPPTSPNWRSLPYLTWSSFRDFFDEEADKGKDETKKPKNIF